MAPPAAAVEAEGVQEAEFAFEDARAGPRQPEGQNNHVAGFRMQPVHPKPWAGVTTDDRGHHEVITKDHDFQIDLDGGYTPTDTSNAPPQSVEEGHRAAVQGVEGRGEFVR